MERRIINVSTVNSKSWPSRKELVGSLRSRANRIERMTRDVVAYCERRDLANKVNAPPYARFAVIGADEFASCIADALDGTNFCNSLNDAVGSRLVSHQTAFYWHYRFRILFPDHPDPIRLMNWEVMANNMACCLWAGWISEASHEASLAYAALNRGYQLALSYEQRHRRASAFLLRLVADWRGGLHHSWPDNLCGDPIYEAILAHWRDSNLSLLESYLLAACDRHIRESRYDTEEHFYDFNDDTLMRTPLEILAVLRLRQLLGLKNPALDHPLMTAPFDTLLENQVELNQGSLVESVLARIRSDWPDYDEVVSLREGA
jgi:hypothetical protein